MRIGVIDLGTNSVRFDVHRIAPDGTLDRLHREKLMIRLGQGAFLSGKLDRAAIRRALHAFTHFQQIARSIGRDTLRAWMDSLQYGNKNLGTHIDSFWLDNSLKISPDEELGLVKKLYFHQLPFRVSVQDMVKKMMVQENMKMSKHQSIARKSRTALMIVEMT